VLVVLGRVICLVCGIMCSAKEDLEMLWNFTALLQTFSGWVACVPALAKPLLATGSDKLAGSGRKISRLGQIDPRLYISEFGIFKYMYSRSTKRHILLE